MCATCRSSACSSTDAASARRAGRRRARGGGIVLPAGAHDHYLARAEGAGCARRSRRPRRRARRGAGGERGRRRPGCRGGARLGRGCRRRLPEALLALARERLAGEPTDDADVARARLRRAAARHPPRHRGDGMVARPPVMLRVEPMRLDDIPAVHAIESASFPTPWPPYAFRGELETNRMAHYLVVRAGFARRRLRRHLAHGRRGPRHDLRGPARRIGAAASAVASCPRSSSSSAALGATRRHARGAPQQCRRPPALPALRLPTRGRPAALLLRQRRGRPHHDHRAPGPARDGQACEPSRGALRQRRAARRPRRSGPTSSAGAPGPSRPVITSRVAGPGPPPRGRDLLRRDSRRRRRAAVGASSPTSWPARWRCTRRRGASSPRSPPAPICAG